MARVTTCDGTGVEIPNDTPTTGLFGHQYCPEARAIAEKYLEELNALQQQQAAAFESALHTLRSSYRDKLYQLPDDVE